MDIDAISTFISTLGFPIAVCVYMIFVNQKQTESHKEEIKTLTEAVTDLKLAITHLVDKIG